MDGVVSQFPPCMRKRNTRSTKVAKKSVKKSYLTRDALLRLLSLLRAISQRLVKIKR